MINQIQKVSSPNSSNQTGTGAWYTRALSLLGAQLFFFVLIVWIMWSTRNANDLSGLAAIFPLYGLYLMALPTIIVSIVALAREGVVGWPVKKIAIGLSIILNFVVLGFWLWGYFAPYFIDDGIRIEPISFAVRLLLV